MWRCNVRELRSLWIHWPLTWRRIFRDLAYWNISKRIRAWGRCGLSKNLLDGGLGLSKVENRRLFRILILRVVFRWMWEEFLGVLLSVHGYKIGNRLGLLLKLILLNFKVELKRIKQLQQYPSYDPLYDNFLVINGRLVLEVLQYNKELLVAMGHLVRYFMEQ